MLHKVMDSEGELEDASNKNFQDYFEVEDVDNHDEFRDEDFVWGSPESKDPPPYHSMRWSHQQFYHM